MKKILFILLINLIILGSLIMVLHPNWEIGSDGYGYYIYLRSLVFDHDFNFYNEYRQFDELYGTRMAPRITDVQRVGNLFSIGPSIFWSPFFFIGHSWQQIFPQADNYTLPGFNPPYQVAIALGSIFYFFIGLIFIYLSLKYFFSEFNAFIISSVIWLISPLIFYLVYEPSMSHALSFAVISALFYFFLKYYRKEQLNNINFLILGLFVGLGSLIRWQNGLYIILPLFLIWQKDSTWKNKLKQLLIMAGTSFLVFLPQLLMWKYLFGAYLVAPQGSKFFDLLSPHLLQFLFSGYHGLFIWHPLLLLSLIGWGAYFKKDKKLTIILLLVLFLQVYINCALSDWMAGGSFGARRMDSTLFIFALGLGQAFILFKNKIYQLSLISLIIVGIGWNLLLMTSIAKGILPLNAPTSISQTLSAPLRSLQEYFH